MTSDPNRRSFLGSAAAASGVFSIVPRHVLGGAGYVAPSDKITLAHIGMGTQGFSELGGLLNEPSIQIVAICDPNKDSSDYVEWGKGSTRNRLRQYIGDANWKADDNGCPGGRDVGKFVVEAFYTRQRGAGQFKSVSTYADYRELLEKEKDVDAVKIMTPDHHHAPCAIAAMKRGKNVMVHKPLSNRMYEVRKVIETTKATGRATHLLAYGAGAGNAKITQRIKEGAIGNLREIHNWSNRPVWPQYTEIPTDRPPVPKGFEWDLWLGPALDRPFHPHYTHTVFRGWYEFGGGSMADMGIYSLWPVFDTLGLPAPASAEAFSTHTCNIVDLVSRPVVNDFAYPTACTIHFRWPDRQLELFWYDGGYKPRIPDEIEAAGLDIPIEGILYVGDKGKIFAGFNGQTPRLFAGGKGEFLFPEDAAQQGQRQRAAGERPLVWLDAFKGGAPSPGNFVNATGISETVALGIAAIRANKKLVFDSAAMKITNVADANKFLYREYRPGWEL
jgi:predicted dehydrogenase